jgi:thiamine monophosphate kinase
MTGARPVVVCFDLSPELAHRVAAAAVLQSRYNDTASDGLAPSHNSISEGLPSSPPENVKFLSESMMKKLKIAGVTVIGSIITGSIAGSKIKHKHCDFQDS